MESAAIGAPVVVVRTSRLQLLAVALRNRLTMPAVEVLALTV